MLNITSFPQPPPIGAFCMYKAFLEVLKLSSEPRTRKKKILTTFPRRLSFTQEVSVCWERGCQNPLYDEFLSGADLGVELPLREESREVASLPWTGKCVGREQLLRNVLSIGWPFFCNWNIGSGVGLYQKRS